jgi:ribosomal protein S18 acetylase RimI-like enzyme
MEKTTIIKSTRIKNDKKYLVDVIYNNFIDLAKNPILMHTKNDINNLLSSPYFIGLFIMINEKLMGYLVGEEKMLNDQRYVYYISYIYIAEKIRYKKYGSMLMNMIEDIIKAKGINYIVLTCDTSNTKLVNFYKKRGYDIDILLQTHLKHNVFSKKI